MFFLHNYVFDFNTDQRENGYLIWVYMSEEEMSFGRLEELLGRDANSLVAMLLEAAAQRRADKVEAQCLRCGKAAIRQKVIGQRASYFCPACQR